ncbi:MAG: MBL fold metallo-hydrolase [Candidatus Diapherotrites archaeon]|nr:MBL fold metallo-hydrolase [Candidatus Diapherotrites archaeon]
MKQDLKFKCLGAGREVGRSSLLLDFGDRVLLDDGVKLTPEGVEYPLKPETNLDAVVISHAHLDHSGNLPSLFLDNHALSFMTSPTLEISKLLWFDSLKIAGLEGFDSGYSKPEIQKTERFAFELGYKKHVNITEKTAMEFYDAGHIVGSALTKLYLPNGKTLLYTGDFNAAETRLHHKADLKCGKVDYLIMESTYGDRNHPPRKETEKAFAESVIDTLDRGGHALVSAFAVGRSQELIDVLEEYKLNVPVYLDGMGQKAAKIMLNNPSYFKNPKFLKRALMKAHWVKGEQMRKKALKEPCVIVTTSGMLQGGPIQYYIKKLYDDSDSKIFLTGFQVEKTPGRILMDTGKIDIDGSLVDVKMKVEKYDFSAHSDHDSLMYAVDKLSPEKIVLVHGDSQVIDVFKQELHGKGFDVVAPRTGEELTL